MTFPIICDFIAEKFLNFCLQNRPPYVLTPSSHAPCPRGYEVKGDSLGGTEIGLSAGWGRSMLFCERSGQQEKVSSSFSRTSLLLLKLKELVHLLVHFLSSAEAHTYFQVRKFLSHFQFNFHWTRNLISTGCFRLLVLLTIFSTNGFLWTSSVILF